MSEKYSVAVQGAQLGKNGLATTAGWMTVYHVDPLNNEYTGASYEYLMTGTGLPADSYADAPTLPSEGQALRRSVDGTSWEHVPDYRGQTVYRTADGKAQMVQNIGALPDDVTAQAPATAFDVWDGTQWVTDIDAQKTAAKKVVQQELDKRKSVASSRIAELTYAANLGIATTDEEAALKAWQTYLVMLSRVDVSDAEITWPDIPTN
ncbi:tail fiber assembly protein [Dickeya dianthicola]|uniref:tail fiber assembly protein n=1 Tax=Dickeya TaxID=204037 RepID=UPI0003D6D97F|nr:MULTISPECIES: tail fiber assembly protein [Dickeya]MBP2844477.1 tail fiber assembly protein [Dickeya oryzae]MCA7001799.1 tail fiber assembly protein [Dickeya dianthicola]MCI4155082.1 tail fiber assembly protein [Dickeya dianthicola]MCI4233694.1 tail fiber assembly protein [Dickeya dianthicola]MCI4239402.1 tail fiber assembly protein [Dickeya dianthicola]